MEKNNYIKIGAGVILLLVAVLFVKNAFSTNNRTPPSLDSLATVEQSTSVQATLLNGVQEVELSWGKLNYNPQEIVVQKGIPVKITGDLKRLTGCFRSLRIDDFDVSKTFTERDNTVTFTPDKTGTFKFACAMGMGRGVLKVQ